MTSRRTALLAFFLGAAATPAAAQQWMPFQPGGAGFRVDFPGKPAINADNSFGTRYGRSVSVTATVETADGIIFYTTYTAYPRGTASSEPDKVLDTVRIGRTAIGTLRSQQRLQFDGHLAQRDMVDWHRPRRLVIVSLDVTRGDWLYSIYCFAPPGLENSPAIQHFLSSFALLPL